VTRRTLHRDAAFADAVDALADAVGDEVPAGGMRRRPQERRRGTRQGGSIGRAQEGGCGTHSQASGGPGGCGGGSSLANFERESLDFL